MPWENIELGTPLKAKTMTEEKKLKVEFAPGAFDSFDGTQEELDEMIAEITTMFAELTPEELESRSRPIDITDILNDDSLSSDEYNQIMKSLLDDNKRPLQ
jgi:hypothetical protein